MVKTRLLVLLIVVLDISFITFILGIPVSSFKPTQRKKLIVDVDAGGDDAFALLLAIAHGGPRQPEILAITCTHGNINVHQVVINVLKTLRVVNETIPVYLGANGSLLITPTGDSFFGNDGFGDVPYPNPPTLEDRTPGHAVNAMIEIVARHPGEVTLIALGPLSNVAMATRLDPTFRANLKDLYWMGGSITGVGNIKPGVEFNAYLDPEANFIVFNTTGPPVIVLPWETCFITGSTTTSWRVNVLGRVNSTYIEFLNGVERKALLKGPTWAACDGKAMAVLLDPSLTTKLSYHHVVAVTQGYSSRGALMIDYSDTSDMPKNAILIEDIDEKRFMKMCLEQLS